MPNRPGRLVGIEQEKRADLFKSIVGAAVLGLSCLGHLGAQSGHRGQSPFAQIYEEAGLPPGLLNVVIGDVKNVGDPFTLHTIPRLISFTGSTPIAGPARPAGPG